MLLLLLLACNPGDDAATGNLEAATWAPPWATHVLYRQVEATSPTEIASSLDTGAEPGETLSAWLEPEGNTVRFLLVEGTDRDAGTSLLDFTLRTAPDIAVTGSYDPAVVLLPRTFSDGDAAESGAFHAGLTYLDTVQTWYGTFAGVAEVSITGPEGDPLVGQVRFGPGVGPIQFVWGGVGADLVWYE